MARDLTASTLAQLQAQALRPVFFVELEIVEGSPAAQSFVRLWSGIGDKSWDSKTWTGAGRLGSISPITETSEIRAEGVSLRLSGVPAALITVALDALRVGLPARIWFGALDASDAVIADPYLAFSGAVDVVGLELGGETCTITVNCESDLIRLQIPNESRMTHSDQQRDFAGDQGFSWVESIQDIQLHWGFGNPTPA